MSGDEIERSAAGRLIRHRPGRAGAAMPPIGPPRFADVEAHVEACIGPISTVLQGTASGHVDFDVLVVEATTERPFHVLVTRGVSDHAMAVPGGLADERHVELVIALPARGPLTREALHGDADRGPLQWLDEVSRLSREPGRWIGWGDAIAIGDASAPGADAPFAGVLVMPPYHLPIDFFRLHTASGEIVTFFQLMPLHADELEFTRTQGAGALEALFETRGIDLLADPQRASVVPAPRRGWWPFKRR